MYLFTDYRLNPVLRKACKADIPKFCQHILNKAKDDIELEGQVISCLKLKYADQVCSFALLSLRYYFVAHHSVADYDWVCVNHCWSVCVCVCSVSRQTVRTRSGSFCKSPPWTTDWTLSYRCSALMRSVPPPASSMCHYDDMQYCVV